MKSDSNPSASGVVYFIASADMQGQPLVKIGFTAGCPRKRRDRLQTGSPVPLDVLVSVPASAEDEKKLHKKFARYRLHGEWFEMRDDLESYIWSLIQ